MDNSKHIIISLGGSLIIPDRVDKEFLKGFVELVIDCITQGYRFTLFTGGGGLCREYNTVVETFRTISTEEKDWLGISITRVNAQLIKTIFGDLAYDEIILDPNILVVTDKPIVVGAGWKPGWSTDNDAVIFAGLHNVTKVINASNIDYVYTKDPRKFTDAQKIEKVTWTEFRTYIPETWEAGLHSPFDPIASKYAQEKGIEVDIVNGTNLPELRNAILGKPFVGTRITP